MPKKDKKNKNAPKKYYLVSVSRNRFSKDIRVSVQDESLNDNEEQLTIEISGLTKENAKNDTALFNLLHYAVAHALHERFPDTLEELHAYNDGFFSDIHTMDIDFADEISAGHSLSFAIPELESYSHYEFKGKDKRDPWEKLREYRYEINRMEGERKLNLKKEGRPPVFLD